MNHFTAKKRKEKSSLRARLAVEQACAGGSNAEVQKLQSFLSSCCFLCPQTPWRPQRHPHGHPQGASQHQGL